MTSCVNEVYVDSFCVSAEKITYNENEIKVGQRRNKEIIARYNCQCVRDKEVCKAILSK